jgi:hypothetical protein
VLVGIHWISLFLNWLHLWFPAHVLTLSAMRVDSRDEEAAAIIFNIVNIITWRLFLLKAAPIGRLLIW